jgi:exopolyphosphatase/guanosine-5'-triphosphate,3'-diphosphate pyrophosphatase
VNKKTGIRIDVIDGSEEARLIFLGASGALDLEGQDVFCFDIGGGSTELIFKKDNEFLFTESLPLGAVRLSHMFFPDFIIDEGSIARCAAHIMQILFENKKLDLYQKVNLNVGTSGTVQSAVLLSHSVLSNLSPANMNGYKLTLHELTHVTTEVLKCRTPAERKSIKGMEVKRADIIPAGLLILKAVFEKFQLDTIVFSDYALREGLILSQIK